MMRGGSESGWLLPPGFHVRKGLLVNTFKFCAFKPVEVKLTA
jgi:hypothetical protein